MSWMVFVERPSLQNGKINIDKCNRKWCRMFVLIINHHELDVVSFFGKAKG